MKLKTFKTFFYTTIGKKQARILLALSSVFILFQLVHLIAPFFIEKFVDEIQNNRFSLTYPKILFYMYSLSFLFGSLLSYVYGKTYMRAKNDMDVCITHKIMQLNPQYIKTKGEGFFSGLMERSLDSIMSLLTPLSVNTFFSLFQNFIVIALLFFKSVPIGIVCSLLFFLYFLSYLLNTKLFSTILTDFIEKSSTSTSLIYDFIKGNKTILASESSLDFATERIKTILTITRKIEFKLQYLFDLLFTFIGRFIQPVMNLVIIGLLGKNVVDGSMTFGAFVLVITYYNILQSGLNSFENITNMMFHAEGALESIDSFILSQGQNERKKIDRDRVDYFYRFEDCSLKFNETLILDAENVELALNQTSCFVGLSGQGKSSIVNMLLGLQNPDSGSLNFLNKNNNCTEVWPLEEIAFFSQNPEIFNMSLKENIFLGDAVDEAEYERLVQLVELEKLKERNLGSGGEHISGGEKQRLALARFLYQLTVKNKAFFIIDEAFVSLDFYTKEKMLALTTEAVKGKTGICITHDDAVFQALGDKVLLCNKENKLVLKDKIKGKSLKDYLDAE